VVPVVPVPQSESVIRAPPRSPSLEPAERSFSTPTIAAALVVVLLAAWGGTRLFHGHSKGQPSAEGTALQQSAAPTDASADQPPPAPAAASPPHPPASEQLPSASRPQHSASQPAVAHHAPGSAEQRRPATLTSSAVIHEEIPRVPQSARETIRGRIKVAVRVTVDRSGNVVRDRFESAGPSRYFNRLASEAARKWKFTSADNEGSREWLLRFEFGRDGTTVHAVRARS